MSRVLLLSSLMVALCCVTACDDTTDPTAAAVELVGTTWEYVGYDVEKDVEIYARVDALPAEARGYAFGDDGALTFRTAGFCATPPLTWFDEPGAWLLHADQVLEISCADMSGFFAIDRLTSDELQLQYLDVVMPPREFFAGDWEGTYTTFLAIEGQHAHIESGSVVVQFEGSRFMVEGEKALLPPSADGYFAADDETIVLRDTLFHTADYDWALNINGKFTWAVNEGELTMGHTIPGRGMTRTFNLRRVDE